MNVWVFQDQPGVSTAAQLRKQGVGTTWTWNIDRYVRSETTPHVEKGDFVLQWQPAIDDLSPAGIYGLGVTLGDPYFQPNEKTNWQVEVKILEVYHSPLGRDRIAHHPVLARMQVIKMAQHIVFKVTDEEWDKLQGLLADLTEVQDQQQ